MSTARGLPRSRAWLRVLVLLLAVLVPGGPAEGSAPPVAAMEIVEYDVLDTAPRPPAHDAHRPAVSPRRAPRPGPAPAAPRGLPHPAPPKPPYAPWAPHAALHTVVLRC
ncbi:hypothetical protein ABZ027_05355 [Streptomyces sp. NPDC006332]|uniref:hypothetical protein n=1 Tax=Streptomyces sp. NPDC006332 TaxID=3155456 RepID=UPI0033B93B2F